MEKLHVETDPSSRVSYRGSARGLIEGSERNWFDDIGLPESSRPGKSKKVTMLYRMYGCDGSLLYVGITESPRVRIKAHERKSDWFPLADKISIEPFPLRLLAEQAERRAIQDECPKFNVFKIDPNAGRWRAKVNAEEAELIRVATDLRDRTRDECQLVTKRIKDRVIKRMRRAGGNDPDATGER